jgi:hypothetical protein
VASTRGKEVEVAEDQDKGGYSSAPCVIFSDICLYHHKNLCSLHHSLSAVYVLGNAHLVCPPPILKENTNKFYGIQ